MNILDIILIGLALAMDAFALTVANCTTYKESLNRKKEWAMPITFALFQGVMPLIGYFIGSLFYGYVAAYIGYVTAGIFFILALKIVIDIIKDARRKEGEADEKPHAKFTVLLLLLQGIATSIDALAVGITLTSSVISVYIAVSVIAAVTFVIVTIALFIGKFLGAKLGKYANYVGAALLFGLALKSLLETILA